MIVRTHQFACAEMGQDGKNHRLHWQNGVFLRKDPHGEAMLELRGREFHVYAEAVWPQYFMDVLERTLQKLITDNWPGMEGRYYFAVPCPQRTDGGTCSNSRHGRSSIDRTCAALKRPLRGQARSLSMIFPRKARTR